MELNIAFMSSDVLLRLGNTPPPIPSPTDRQNTKEHQHAQRHQENRSRQACPQESRTNLTDVRARMRTGAVRLLRCRERSRASALVRCPAELAPFERAVDRGGRKRAHERRQRDVRAALCAVPAREGHVHRAEGRGGRPVFEHQAHDGLGAPRGLAQLEHGRAGVVDCGTEVSLTDV